jgi:uncharacterized membrane protein HdeD (DUF308 family)
MMKYFGLVMSAFYLAVGLGFLFTNMLAELVPTWRTAIGAVITGYGLLRFYMWWRKRASGTV